MSPKVDINLSPPINGKYYTTNEPLEGALIVKLEKAFAIRKIELTLRGVAQTLVRQEGADYQYVMSAAFPARSCHILVDRKLSLFPPENVSKAISMPDKAFTLSKGSYDYPFQFLMPYEPRCMTDHGANLSGFNSNAEEARIPPSFNSDSAQVELTDFETYYYKMGTIHYYLKAQVFMGKSKFRLTPFSSLAESYKMIEFIPETMEEGNQSADLESGIGPTEKFVSNNDLVLGQDITGWVEVRTKRLNRVHRMDYLFKPGCRRFDRIYLKFTSKPDPSIIIKITQLQLNILEVLEYLSHGHVNTTIGRIPLIEVPLNKSLNAAELKVSKNGTAEWPLNISKMSELNNYRFNENDMKYKGNALYSFKCCNIKRSFKFQLKIRVEIDGVPVETEVLTPPTKIECKLVVEQEQLPRYEVHDVPPDYGYSIESSI